MKGIPKGEALWWVVKGEALKKAAETFYGFIFTGGIS